MLKKYFSIFIKYFANIIKFVFKPAWPNQFILFLLLGATINIHAQENKQIATESVFEEEIILNRYANNEQVVSFIDDMVASYDFDRATLNQLFSQVSYSASAVKLVTATGPKAVKNWRQYLTRIINNQRIEEGIRFYNTHISALNAAAREYGVPPAIIVAIIGLETSYGQNTGSFHVFDVLSTLAFDYPAAPNQEARRILFRKNLEDYLIWTRANNIDPRVIQGSYTGAIGLPQFMPSSILKYAVSTELNRSVDLINNINDAIFSVANFLKQHGWQTGRPIAWPIANDQGSYEIASAGLVECPSKQCTLQKLTRAGLFLNSPNNQVLTEMLSPITIVDLPTPEERTQFLVGFQNFDVIMNYNRSYFYATSVFELANRLQNRISISN